MSLIYDGGIELIQKPTAFVLGAGASAPFGFPLGQELCDRVISYLDSGHQQRVHFLNTTRFSESDLDHFREELRTSAQPSVDAFLEYRTEFINIGKAAMAVLLIGCEQKEELWKNAGSWLRYVFSHMRCAFDEFKGNRVSFITFNYDRSVEYFFTNAMRATYGKSIEKCEEVFSESVPLIHLHGRLGYLPWETDSAGRDYDIAVSPESVELCVTNIKIVHEDISDGRDKDFEQAQNLLKEAEHVTFLGVGYGQKNLQRLKIASLPASKVVGSGYGLTQKECVDIRSQWNSRIRAYAGIDCIGVLRNHIDLW